MEILVVIALAFFRLLDSSVILLKRYAQISLWYVNNENLKRIKVVCNIVLCFVEKYMFALIYYASLLMIWTAAHVKKLFVFWEMIYTKLLIK